MWVYKKWTCMRLMGLVAAQTVLVFQAEALSPPVVRRRYVLCFTDRRWDIGRGVHFVDSARVHGLLNLAPSLVPGRERGVVVVSEFPAATANLMLTDSISR